MKRRQFLQTTVAGAVSAATLSGLAQAADASKEPAMTIVVAADPFAVDLKDAIKEHLATKGYTVLDVGVEKGKETPYYDLVPAAAEAITSGKAERGILFCGTGAGMCIVANKFKGLQAVCVESVFAAKMARAINDSNVLTMGAMIVAPWMAKEMVDAWLDTKHTQGLEPFADFLKGACAKVDAIDAEHCK